MSDNKEKLKLLVTAYAKALKGGNYIPAEVKKRIPTFDPEALSDTSALTKVALQLATDAFKAPHQMYFRKIPDGITHWMHLEAVLSLSTLKKKVEEGVEAVNDYLKICLKRLPANDSTNILLLLTDPLPFSPDVLERADELFEVFLGIGRLNGCQFGPLINNLIEPSTIDTTATTLIDGERIQNSVLFARFLAFLVVSAVGLDFKDTMSIANFIDVQLSTDEEEAALSNALRRMTAQTLEKIVEHFQENLSLQLLGGAGGRPDHDQLRGVSRVIGVLYKANYTEPHPRGLISHDKFYNGTATDLDMESMKDDFGRRLENKSRARKGNDDRLFCFSDFPFLVDANFKSVILQFESMVDQQEAMRNALVGMMFNPRGRQEDTYFCVLKIQRARLIETALREMSRKSQDELRKPLRVKFHGEDGIDEGGLRKEFFQLICKELFDPNYGMFTMDEKKRFFWIQSTTKCNTCNLEFHLIGQILGLAVFNNVILDVAFPKVLFRKLLGQKVGFEDLKELDPDFAQGLEDLLAFEETEDMKIEDVFCRNFTYEHDVFGQTVEIEIIPGGSNIQLTAANRTTFVEAMTQYVLSGAIDRNFEEFRRGFLSVCQKGLIQSMHPAELELLICGNPELDFSELQEYTRYDGYEEDDQSVVLFWDVVKEFTVDQQRLFLKFCTGSDRVPIRGLKDLNFVIGKNGDEGDLLPTAHTCFNHLLLPQYKSKEVLRQKLLLAIENCTGFGLK